MQRISEGNAGGSFSRGFCRKEQESHPAIPKAEPEGKAEDCGSGAAVLVCVVLFGVGTWYYGRTWTADSSDVKMSVEASGSIATLRFTPQEDTVLYVEADENEENTIVITEGYRNPLKKVYQKSAYYGYTFIDKNTVMGLNGKSTKIDEDDVLTIRYEDKTETISMQELAKEALANNPERTFSE